MRESNSKPIFHNIFPVARMRSGWYPLHPLYAQNINSGKQAKDIIRTNILYIYIMWL